jgi:hypothetical protein
LQVCPLKSQTQTGGGDRPTCTPAGRPTQRFTVTVKSIFSKQIFVDEIPQPNSCQIESFFVNYALRALSSSHVSQELQVPTPSPSRPRIAAVREFKRLPKVVPTVTPNAMGSECQCYGPEFPTLSVQETTRLQRLSFSHCGKPAASRPTRANAEPLKVAGHPMILVRHLLGPDMIIASRTPVL